MKRAIVLTCVFVVLFIWLFRAPAGCGILNPTSAPPPAAAKAVGPDSLSSRHDAAAAQPARTSSPLEISDLARELNSPASDIRADLKTLGLAIDTFRSNARANPTGTNAEITATLAGKNAFRLALIPPAHPAINAQGELCDRWGRPFFFHQVSGIQMEIRSAGPDRKMWTDDDALFVP